MLACFLYDFSVVKMHESLSGYTLFIFIDSIHFFSIQTKGVKAESPIQITSITPVNYFGNIDFLVDRGLQMSVVVVLDSQLNGTFSVHASLSDNCSVPVGIAEENFLLNEGNNTVVLKINVARYANVGLGSLHVTVSETNGLPIVSSSLTVYIHILGDFNKDGVINSLDTSHLIDALMYYENNHSIPSFYKSCDFNGDGRIGYDGVFTFVDAYIAYWSAQ